MSDEKPKVSDKASEIAKNIWLAGLGAYGKAFDDAQDRIDKAAKEPPRLFRELVEKGSMIEDEVRDSLSSIKESSTNSVEERISKVRESFNFSFTRGQELADIHRKLDELSAKIDTLADAVGAGKGSGAGRSKSPSKTRSKSTRGRKPGGSSRA
jgi:polyhydroxyalkanoate synthesis regulator phasin